MAGTVTWVRAATTGGLSIPKGTGPGWLGGNRRDRGDDLHAHRRDPQRRSPSGFAMLGLGEEVPGADREEDAPKRGEPSPSAAGGIAISRVSPPAPTTDAGARTGSPTATLGARG